jgi:polysaccharide export outer membrane protein
VGDNKCAADQKVISRSGSAVRVAEEEGMGKGYAWKLSALPIVVVGVICLLGIGCKVTPADVPKELNMIAHPEYTIEAPDILLIDAVNLIPRPPYRIAPFDGLLIRVTVSDPKEKELPNELVKGEPINGLYRVEPSGEIDLGFSYKSVAVAGLEIKAAKAAIMKHLQERFLAKFDVSVSLGESRALQLIKGEHLVGQDGKVSLGMYGSVFVVGLTRPEAKHAIEAQLSQALFEPEISIDVIGYNSKVYYVIFEQGSAGQAITRLPITGNETVLDAISQIKGMPPGSDRTQVWVARRVPAGQDGCQVLPVDWNAIVCGGSTATNYQLLAGDRVFVGLDPWIRCDQILAKVIAPFERLSGFILLGSSVVHSVPQPILGGNGANNVNNLGLGIVR